MLETLSSVFPGFGKFTEIGRGGFSSVFSAVHTKIQNLEIAIKVVNKYEILSADDKRNFEFEVQVLKRLDFPFIITFYDLRENNEFFFISMELAKNGTLLDMINEKKQLDKDSSMRIFCQLSSTLYYLHNVIDSIHRDIKVENIMFDDQTNVRLIDFGFSQIIKSKSKDSGKGRNKKIFTTLCGSYPYAAPEMLRLSPYSKPVDIWALGIVFYVCLVGKLPFDDPSIPKLAKMIVFNEPNYPDDIDEDVKELLKRLLTKNPSERPTIEEIREYDLIKKSPYSIFFDVIGNENFMVKNYTNSSEKDENDNSDPEKDDDVRDLYLDAEIINNLVQLGLDPTKVFSEGTEEMLLYRAQRKKKIEQIIGDDQLFRETLNQKNIPQKLLVQVTQKSKKQQKQQQQQAKSQEESNQQKAQSKNHHVEFAQQTPQQQKRSTPQRQNQNQNTGNQDDDIIPNYQNYKQIKTNQKFQSSQNPQQLQNLPNQQQNLSSIAGTYSNSQQQLQQTLQAQIQQQVQLQLQQKQPPPQNPQQSQLSPFPLHVNSQRGTSGNSEVTKSLVRINRKQHRSSSVASILRMPPPVQFGTQLINHQQPISKTSSSGQANQQPCSQISFQGTPSQASQIMVIQKKRRAPSLGSHTPSFQSLQSTVNANQTGPPSSSESDRGHSKKIKSSISYANEQADPSTPTSLSRSSVHSQATSSGREVAPIMRPRKKSGKGHFISIISK